MKSKTMILFINLYIYFAYADKLALFGSSEREQNSVIEMEVACTYFGMDMSGKNSDNAFWGEYNGI